MAEPRKAVIIRLPESMAAELKEAAELDRRSVNGAVEMAVQLYIRDVESRLGERMAAA